ncbi:hypothetical protein HIM_05893 [Hirsutella minnesotensis 3608]|uniref:Uncharacterized protein n=1 Tax=Hirsutella minnesotensis 3608 TaxID=1043627 RepID=A0A0F7ZJX8_9HYPO|nr:hypothetical protein HIM_05893 [Hirsutella minnesotensis 3608]
MRVSTALVAAVAGPAAANPVEKDNRQPFEKWTREELREWNRADIKGRWPNLPESTLEAFSEDHWLEKYRKYKWAMEKIDYDWSKAYAMDPVVEDIHCNKKESYASCQSRCEAHYKHKLKLDVPILAGAQGVWFNLSHTNPGDCLQPRRLCWNVLDWERKEEVLVQQIGGEKMGPYVEGKIYADVKLLSGAIDVKGYRFYC